METTKIHAPPARRRGWLRKLCWIVGVLVVLVVIAGFVVTSGAFFKGVILPRVGAAMNAEVTVNDATIRPFSRVELRDLVVKPNGQETLLTAREVRLRYDLLALLRGNLVVNEVLIESPLVQVVQNADGTSNLDPILGSQPVAKEPASSPEPGATGEPPRIDVKRVMVNNATARLIRHYAGGQRDLTELSAARLSLEDLRNGGAGKVELGGLIQVDQNPPAPGTNAALQASIDGGFQYELTTDLQPRAVRGDLRLEVRSAGGALGDLNALRLLLNCDWSPTEIRELALRLQRAGADLAAMTVKGPFDAAKGEGRLGLELWGVDRQLLNLVGAPWGAQFNDTKLASTNRIELAQGGEAITASGALTASKFSLTQTGQTTPELDFAVGFDLTLNQSVLELRTARLNLTPTARGRNQLDVTGRVDYSKLDAITGALKLAAESLDVTTLYDQFTSRAAAAGATVPPDASQPGGGEGEPVAVIFPVRDFTCDAEIGRFSLREIEVTNLLARLKVDGGRIVVNPLQLSLNGAPVTGQIDFNLGVPGTEYDLSLNANRVPIEPMVNSFLPEYRGQAKGELIARVQIRGAGTTDASLRRHLSGQNGLSFTNAAIKTDVLTNMFGVLERSPNAYVRTAWRLLEPTSIPFKVLSPLMSGLAAKLSLGDLSTLPLSAIDAQVNLGQGNITTACSLWSSAFALSVGGDMGMATVLTNSPIRDWPVNLSLSRALAQKVPYLTANAPTNAAYVALPVLFKVKGTLGSPTTSFEAAAFAQLTARSLLQGQNIGGVDAGNVVQGLSDLLGGKKPDGAPSTNQPASGPTTNRRTP